VVCLLTGQIDVLLTDRQYLVVALANYACNGGERQACPQDRVFLSNAYPKRFVRTTEGDRVKIGCPQLLPALVHLSR
jgi:hypothetical protein